MKTEQANNLLVQFGCGLSAPEAWLNYDSSPRLRLERLPLIGNLIPSGPYGRFPKSVCFGDIVAGLPLKAGSARLIYSSHVLEHLSLDDLRTALRNCFSLLQPGGIFRTVLPDLERLIRGYFEDGDPGAAERFIQYSGMGRKSRVRGLLGFGTAWLGNSHRLWLWDYKGLKRELEAVGFRNVRRAEFGDSQLPEFSAVEAPDRWRNALGFQCEKTI